MKFILILMTIALSSCASQTIPDFQDLYLDTCAEGDISDDPNEAHAQGYECAVNLIRITRGKP